MFYIHSNSSLEFDSNSALDLSAPTSGTYNGILFFQSRSNSVLARIDSNVVNDLTGVLYFPNNHLVLDSNSQMTSPGTCTQIVASTIEFNSNAGLDMDYDPATCPSGTQQRPGHYEIVLTR